MNNWSKITCLNCLSDILSKVMGRLWRFWRVRCISLNCLSDILSKVINYVYNEPCYAWSLNCLSDILSGVIAMLETTDVAFNGSQLSVRHFKWSYKLKERLQKIISILSQLSVRHFKWSYIYMEKTFITVQESQLSVRHFKWSY